MVSRNRSPASFSWPPWLRGDQTKSIAHPLLIWFLYEECESTFPTFTDFFAMGKNDKNGHKHLQYVFLSVHIKYVHIKLASAE